MQTRTTAMSQLPWRLSLLVLAVAASSCNLSHAKETPPNIVLILADDFGVGDIQAHYPKNKIPTPYLDRFVRQGMSFMDAHSPSAVCTPTRYGLLTGRYAWRTRLQEWVLASYEPPLIDAGRLTLPGLLKEHGYHTAAVGKWHLGWEWPGPQRSRMVEDRNALWRAEWDFSKPLREGPTRRGFDEYFGTHVPNFPPFTFIENDRILMLPTARYKYDADEGVVMPKNFAGAPMAPGWRFDQILPNITKRAVDYIHQRAEMEAPFFLLFAMTSPHEPVVPSKDFAGRSGIAPIADFVMETDWSAGQVIQAVEEAGIADDTIVIFTADNGHSHYTGWDSLIEAGHMPSGSFRGHKGDIWEGGHRVPFVVRWPGHVASSSRDQLLCLTDIYATVADLLGRERPENVAEDSFSFLSTLLGKGTGAAARTSLVSHSVDGEFAYREGPWKVVFRLRGRNLKESRSKPAVVELYNLDADINEQNDLAKQHPEIVQRLTAGLGRIVDRGTSRPTRPQSNDTDVRFDVIQTERWAPPLK
ncbi:MAG: sulfatase-like hydrolase/transferase [Luteitalea sp.]|nr:sulfatase-like hydrolase/transferase [Luteitalea sp.]